MEPGEALGIAAQIAVALAGFAGVVVVFRREAVHEWSGIDKLRLHLLLANSILPLSLSMLGLLLLTVEPMPLGIWRWCSGITLVAILLLVTAISKMFRRLNLQNVQRQRDTPIHFLRVRSLRRCSHALASIQHCVTRRVLAIFRRNRIPTRYGNGSICADDPSAAGIKPHTVCPAKFTPQLRCREGDRNPP
jgi:hypothetical protein